MKQVNVDFTILALCCCANACSGSDSAASAGAGGVVKYGSSVALGGMVSTGGGTGKASGGMGQGTSAASGGAASAAGGSSVSGTSGGTSATITTARGGSTSATSATGTKATGGSSKGGTSGTGTGGIAIGGTSVGGTTSTGGTANCPLPTTFKWTSTGALATPKTGWVSLKDFSSVVNNGEHLVYMSTVDTAGAYAGAMMRFSDWSQMATAKQTPLPYGGSHQRFSISNRKSSGCSCTSGDLGPSRISPRRIRRTFRAGPVLTTSIRATRFDETVVCNTTTCYLFFANDDGTIRRASMPIGSFPGTFTNATTIMTDTRENLFEAVQVYSVKGANQYLMIVEAMGTNGRYFRSFTATDLGGTWTPLAATEANPFAGKANVTFNGTAWTADISSGDLVRVNPDETQTIDPCNLQFLYQGLVPTTGSTYNQLPWQPGVLTLVR
ncbi:MAG: non-reducing end alpha-L-arabinofuranosidase family hydrolase [Polyangiaceae bacterium]